MQLTNPKHFKIYIPKHIPNPPLYTANTPNSGAECHSADLEILSGRLLKLQLVQLFSAQKKC